MQFFSGQLGDKYLTLRVCFGFFALFGSQKRWEGEFYLDSGQRGYTVWFTPQQNDLLEGSLDFVIFGNEVE